MIVKVVVSRRRKERYAVGELAIFFFQPVKTVPYT